MPKISVSLLQVLAISHNAKSLFYKGRGGGHQNVKSPILPFIN